MTQNDRSFFYTIYDGQSWSAPKNLSLNGGLGETSLAVYRDTIVFGYTSAPFNSTLGTTRALFAYYDIPSDAWSSEQALYNFVGSDLVADNATQKSETDVQVSVHEGRFVFTWQRNQV